MALPTQYAEQGLWCLSVAAVCDGFAAVGPAGRRYRLNGTTAWRAAAMRAVPRLQLM